MMKFQIRNEDMIKFLPDLIRFVPSRAVNPSSQGIKTESRSDGSLKFTASSNESGINCYTTADVIQPGEAVIPARMLLDVSSKLPPDAVLTVASDSSGHIEIKTGEVEIKLPAYPVDSFMDITEISNSPDDGPVITMTQGDFKKFVRDTIYAVSETNSTLGGLQIKSANGKVHFIGVSNHRSAWRWKNENLPEFSVIVPKRTITEIVKVMQGGENDTIDIRKQRNRVVVKCGPYKIVSVIMTDCFPDIRSLIARHNIKDGVSLTINRERLCQSLSRSMIVAAGIPTVTMHISENEVTVENATELGKVSEKIPCLTNGKRLTVRFNTNYLLDALQYLSDAVRMDFALPNNICLVRRPGYINLVAPIANRE